MLGRDAVDRLQPVGDVDEGRLEADRGEGSERRDPQQQRTLPIMPAAMMRPRLLVFAGMSAPVGRYFFSIFQKIGIGLVTTPDRPRVAPGKVYWPRWICVP